MHFQFRKSQRIIQLAALALFLFPAGLSGDLLEDLLQGGLDTVGAADQMLLDLTSVSDEEENQIGSELRKEILNDCNTAEYSRFNTGLILQKIVRNCNRKSLDYEVTVLESDVFNAYAVAGGKIFINTGLLDGLDDVDEVAFVIAHEVAHNELKHCINKIQHAYQASKIDPTLAAVVQVAYSTYQYPFSKNQERQADKLGVELMVKAGYDKQGAISFFRKLSKIDIKSEDSNIQDLNDFVSTHPATEERIKNIEQM